MNIWKDRKFTPMLLKEISKPFNSKDYIFELKFDGIRALIFVNKSSIYIQSRNCVDMTNLFPELYSIKKLVKNDVIFDGEIVSFKDGVPSFSDVQKRVRLKSEVKIKSFSNNEPVNFVVFDILYKDKDLTKLSLSKRKEILSNYKDTDVFIKSKVIEEYGVKFFGAIKKMGLEGIVAKKKDGLYHINKRTDDFIKIKNIKDGDFLVGGYEKKKEGFLSLAIGEYINDDFYFVGKVSVRSSSNIYKKILDSKESKNYFKDCDEDIFYIKPTIKVNVEYLERTKENHLRHPIYKEK